MTKQEYNQILNELQIFLDSKTPEEFDKYLDDLDSEYTAYNEQDYPSVHNLGICLSPITINFFRRLSCVICIFRILGTMQMY